jgi:hypothetical protein
MSFNKYLFYADILFYNIYIDIDSARGVISAHIVFSLPFIFLQKVLFTPPSAA